MLVHTGEKPHACTLCSQQFKMSRHLNKHMIHAHSGVRGKHKCEECNKVFSAPSDLKIHMQFHSGLRPYACNECDKAFMRTGDLKKHLRVHTTTEQYA